MCSRVPFRVLAWIASLGLSMGCGDNMKASSLVSVPDPGPSPEPASIYTGAGEDGCSGAARDLSISGVAIYQTVRIALDAEGVEVATDSRNADVVAGRDGLFRVTVAVATGWLPRRLSARVFVRNGDDIESFFSKVTINGDSDEADLRTTFQVHVPKEKIDLDTAYAVEVVECTPPAGTVITPRFPEGSDFAALGARKTGGLKIHVVPVMVNGNLPDTAPADLDKYGNMMLAMYPIETVEFTVGDPITVDTYPVDWLAALDQLRALRAAEAPDPDIYYFGLMKPVSTLREYCGDSCTMGIGYVAGAQPSSANARVALAAGFGDRVSIEVMPHEIGHNHGRNHSPCVVMGATIAGIDLSFPYADGRDGVYGWDLRSMTLMSPGQADIMGYCNSKWISDYTYQGLVERVATVNVPVSAYEPAELIQAREVLLLDGAGPRWGRPITTPAVPTGDPEFADILDAGGNVLERAPVYRTAISDLGAASFEVPRPHANWVAVRIQGSPAIAFQRR
jgi:Metallo-peptidase family M12B Reprolysin-like